MATSTSGTRSEAGSRADLPEPGVSTSRGRSMQRGLSFARSDGPGKGAGATGEELPLFSTASTLSVEEVRNATRSDG